MRRDGDLARLLVVRDGRVEERNVTAGIVEGDAVESVDVSGAVEFWDITNRQDWAICESVQRGIAARPHHHGYYAPMEDYSLDIRRYVAERLGLD